MQSFSQIKSIYNKLQDEQSKHIFLARLKAYITEDNRYICAENQDDISDIVFDNSNKFIIYGTGENAYFVYNFFKLTLSIICFCEDVGDKSASFCGLPVISADELISDYKNCKILFVPEDLYTRKLHYLLKHNTPYSQIITFKIHPGIQYFDLPYFIPTEHEVFVDAGSYNGDTILDFLNWCKQKYDKIYAFEPDINNFKDLNLTMKNNCVENVLIYNKGLWSKNDTLQFNNTHTISSKVSYEGKLLISVDSIDNIIADNPVTFLKMDVEGSEIEALKGSIRTITKYKPRLAICIYHKSSDILDIPIHIAENFPFYKFYIRKYSYFNVETILYAIT